MMPKKLPAGWTEADVRKFKQAILRRAKPISRKVEEVLQASLSRTVKEPKEVKLTPRGVTSCVTMKCQDDTLENAYGDTSEKLCQFCSACAQI